MNIIYAPGTIIPNENEAVSTHFVEAASYLPRNRLY